MRPFRPTVSVLQFCARTLILPIVCVVQKFIFNLAYRQGRRQRGGSSARTPHLKLVPPCFTFGPLVVTYIQYSIFKMWLHLLVLAPPSVFLPPFC